MEILLSPETVEKIRTLFPDLSQKDALIAAIEQVAATVKLAFRHLPPHYDVVDFFKDVATLRELDRL